MDQARIIRLLEERSELDNTVIIVTSGHGTAFPASNAICSEYGIYIFLKGIRIWDSTMPDPWVPDSRFAIEA